MERYEIAGLQVDMAVSGRTKRQAAAYAVPASGAAELILQCDPAAVLRQYPELGDPEDAEYVGTGSLFAKRLLDFGGFQLHASAVVTDGRAYLFSAPSGMGKSTHAEKWVRLFGASYLNDDKPALRRQGDIWMAYGTPWSGKHDLSSPTGAPLGGIAFLWRGQENRITAMEAAQALPLLMSQTVYRLPREQMERLLTMADHILRNVPIWRLECRNDDEAARVSYAAMTG